MNKKIFAERVAKLVAKKGLSEYRISREIGQCPTYIGKVASGKIYPSMGAFFTMCEYFGIEPSEFFEPNLDKRGRNLNDTFSQLSDSDKEKVEEIADALLHKKKYPKP